LDISIARAAHKELSRLPKGAQEKIVSALEKLADDPRPRGLEKIRGRPDYFRIRAGGYRIIYHIFQEAVIIILVVRDRKHAYDKVVLEGLDARRRQIIETDPKVIRLVSRS
tara:strand:- start:65873 stop:66205 length:333 start_codon:yes stop_codon:yes gene_type:complete